VVIKKVKIVSISEYARHYKIDRKTVYRLIEEGTLTRYEGEDGNPALSLAERPSGVKRYKGYRERRMK
jgi:hypothetical protein